MTKQQKKCKLAEDCRNLASALQDGTAPFPAHFEPGEFDPMINQLYRAADVLERTMVSLGLQLPGDADRVQRLACFRTAKSLWQRASGGTPYKG